MLLGWAELGHRAWRRRETARVPEFCRNGQRGEIIHAAEAPQASDARAQRLKIQQAAQIRFDVTEASQRFIHRAQVRGVGLVECRQRPSLRQGCDGDESWTAPWYWPRAV